MKTIWEDIRKKLGLVEDEPEVSDERLVQYATAALLLELCEADLDIDHNEVRTVRKALEEAFGLQRADIDRLVDRALRAAKRQVSFHPQVEIINQHCGPEEKTQIVESLWRVAFADGRLDKYEEHYVRRLCDLIHVPHRVFLQARHRVEEERAG